MPVAISNDQDQLISYAELTYSFQFCTKFEANDFGNGLLFFRPDPSEAFVCVCVCAI